MSGRSALVLAVVLAGCLLPKPPAAPRYFAPATPPSDAAGVPVAVDLASVRAPLHLREQMTWRRSDVEYGFYEQRRWTELPATYVERALARELYAGADAPVVVSKDEPVLTAEVRAFEEVLTPAHEARVVIEVEVVTGGCVRLRRTFAASRPVDGDDPRAVARAIGEALDETVRECGRAVRSALAAGGGCRPRRS